MRHRRVVIAAGRARARAACATRPPSPAGAGGGSAIWLRIVPEHHGMACRRIVPEHHGMACRRIVPEHHGMACSLHERLGRLVLFLFCLGSWKDASDSPLVVHEFGKVPKDECTQIA